MPEDGSGLELTASGSLWISAALSARYFPHDVLVPLHRGRELWLLPTRGPAGGGLILKQRNRAGDRSVLIWEALPPGLPAGPLDSYWDEARGALRVALPAGGPPRRGPDSQERPVEGPSPAAER